MLRSVIMSLTIFLSLNGYTASNACPPSSSTNTINFCSSFKASAECYCTSSGLPKGMCNNMTQLYNRMISMFGSLQRACEFQHNTPTQNCIDDWNCYRNGGNNSQNELCSSTGKACE